MTPEQKVEALKHFTTMAGPVTINDCLYIRNIVWQLAHEALARGDGTEYHKAQNVITDINLKLITLGYVEDNPT